MTNGRSPTLIDQPTSAIDSQPPRDVAPEAGWPGPALRVVSVVRAYPRPFIMLGLLLVSLALDVYVPNLGDPLALIVIVLGATPLVREAIRALREHRYALDYLALLAIAAAVAAVEFQVGAVIALMLASGQALEDYGVRRARRSLSLLADRIPRIAQWSPMARRRDATPPWSTRSPLGSGSLVRHGEVLPLDGELLERAGSGRRVLTYGRTVSAGQASRRRGPQRNRQSGATAQPARTPRSARFDVPPDPRAG